MSLNASLSEDKPLVIPPEVAARLDTVVLRMFASLDFHCVDMRSIAREAAMSFATIYRYFQNKEKLLFWFIARWLEPLNQSAKAVMETDKPIEAKLYDRLAVHLQFYEENPNVGRVIFLTVPLERWMRDETFAYREPSKALLREIINGQKNGQLRDDVPGINLLDAYTGMFNRTFLMWEYRQRQYKLTSQLDSVFAILWDGIKAK
ncbi:transcriptional regulator, TetR family [Bordetella bronchiseptica MBORD678]|nr:TetR/AcrR family transcriptional regulator [Bordetella bronchiseptica]KDD07877.1 transcriptional regulator, TetR family [Bordetella bronchiseptica MBORD681]KDD88495.1 transcriptional regulator, TetR family [Bordetella bronchiseptica MBORD762]KDD94164.1 transcriptional regulator, TetR family [Bordetella bronchiseptica MBORD678]KAK65371.1 transcriptional regulator, TetR family [Bordetella bronchiseptica MO211]CCN16801.1 transcriptional regulator, tetr family [Bordetella bronchiseptica MO211]